MSGHIANVPCYTRLFGFIPSTDIIMDINNCVVGVVSQASPLILQCRSLAVSARGTSLRMVTRLWLGLVRYTRSMEAFKPYLPEKGIRKLMPELNSLSQTTTINACIY